VWWCLIDGIFSLWIPFSQALTNVGKAQLRKTRNITFTLLHK
jgi:hypothetical protein